MDDRVHDVRTLGDAGVDVREGEAQDGASDPHDDEVDVEGRLATVLREGGRDLVAEALVADALEICDRRHRGRCGGGPIPLDFNPEPLETGRRRMGSYR